MLPRRQPVKGEAQKEAPKGKQRTPGPVPKKSQGKFVAVTVKVPEHLLARFYAQVARLYRASSSTSASSASSGDESASAASPARKRRQRRQRLAEKIAHVNAATTRLALSDTDHEPDAKTALKEKRKTVYAPQFNEDGPSLAPVGRLEGALTETKWLRTQKIRESGAIHHLPAYPPITNMPSTQHQLGPVVNINIERIPPHYATWADVLAGFPKAPARKKGSQGSSTPQSSGRVSPMEERVKDPTLSAGPSSG